MTDVPPQHVHPGLPPRDKPQTVAEAKARILAHGEKTSRDLEATVNQWKLEARKAAKWLPLVAIAAGIVMGGGRKKRWGFGFGGGERERSRRGRDEPPDSGSKWSGIAGVAARMAAPVLLKFVGTAVERVKRSRARSRQQDADESMR